jgi:phosphopentomutase
MKHSTDHTREYVLLLVFNRRITKGVNLGIRQTFADIAVTIAENFGLNYTFPGMSFLSKISSDRGAGRHDK